MKILHILNTGSFSGAENVATQIIQGMKNQYDCESVYCSLDGDIREALALRNIAFYPIDVLSCSEVHRVIKAYQPDVIHAHDMRASFVASLVCGKIPLISHIHNNAPDSRCLSVKTFAYLLPAAKAKHIFFVSNSSCKCFRFKRYFDKKISVLHNYIKVDAVQEKMNADKASYDYDVIFLGRLAPEKNPQRLIQIISIACRKKKNLKVAIVGSGSLDEEIKRLAAEKGVTDNITFFGFVQNPMKILHDSKLMIFVSLWEGTPMSGLEAMALGIPIVSTPTDGLCEIISDGVTGYISDCDDILAEKVLAIAEDPILRDRLSKNTMELLPQINSESNNLKAIRSQYLLALK